MLTRIPEKLGYRNQAEAFACSLSWDISKNCYPGCGTRVEPFETQDQLLSPSQVLIKGVLVPAGPTSSRLRGTIEMTVDSVWLVSGAHFSLHKVFESSDMSRIDQVPSSCCVTQELGS